MVLGYRCGLAGGAGASLASCCRVRRPRGFRSQQRRAHRRRPRHRAAIAQLDDENENFRLATAGLQDLLEDAVTRQVALERRVDELVIDADRMRIEVEQAEAALAALRDEHHVLRAEHDAPRAEHHALRAEVRAAPRTPRVCARSTTVPMRTKLLRYSRAPRRCSCQDATLA